MYYSNRGMARNMLIALEAYNSKTILLIDSKLEIEHVSTSLLILLMNLTCINE